MAQSATGDDSLVGVFSYKPFGTKLDWSLVAKASPCYMTVRSLHLFRVCYWMSSYTSLQLEHFCSI